MSARRGRPGSAGTCCSGDYLRVSAAARAAYVDVKFAASRRWRGDRMGYNAAKTRVILDITQKAETWAARGRR